MMELSLTIQSVVLADNQGLRDMKIEVVVSGDRSRRQLGESIAKAYTGYLIVDRVWLMYERNPAIAFNKGARSSQNALILFCGGDCIIDERNMTRLVEVLLISKKKVAYANPGNWKENYIPSGFVSGMFVAFRDFVLDHPFIEWPDFCEEIPYRVLYADEITVANQIPWEHRHDSSTIHRSNHRIRQLCKVWWTIKRNLRLA